jgi:hypothetical protein
MPYFLHWLAWNRGPVRRDLELLAEGIVVHGGSQDTRPRWLIRDGPAGIVSPLTSLTGFEAKIAPLHRGTQMPRAFARCIYRSSFGLQRVGANGSNGW